VLGAPRGCRGLLAQRAQTGLSGLWAQLGQQDRWDRWDLLEHRGLSVPRVLAASGSLVCRHYSVVQTSNNDLCQARLARLVQPVYKELWVPLVPWVQPVPLEPKVQLAQRVLLVQPVCKAVLVSPVPKVQSF
jgi:hypothetical protein